MKPNPIVISLLLSLTSLAGHAQEQPSFAVLEAMDRECSTFLSGMPANRQHEQAVAIRQAMAGHPAALRNIRQGRNTPPQLPADVQAAYVRPDLCLFSPRTCSLRPRPLLLYLHGGGWTFGSINSCAKFCAELAIRGNCCVAALDYRLAPEHPYPAALDDCRRALAYIHRQAEEWNCDTTRISIGGDSAGGNLAIAAAMEDRRLYGLLPIYPVTKLYAVPSPSWEKYGKGFGNDTELLLTFYDAYTSSHVQDPSVSVGDAPDSLLLNLPRTLVISAGRDILLDQGTAFVQRLHQIGLSHASQVVFPTATHLFITVPGQPTAFEEAVKLAAAFIQ